MNIQTTTRNLLHVKSPLSLTAVALALLITLVQTTYPQTNPDPNKPGSNPTTTPTPQPQLPSLEKVKVIGISKLGETKSPNDTTPVQAGIRDIIVLKVQNLGNLVKYANCKALDERPVQPCQPQKISLFLDGREIKGLLPESGAPDPQTETLQFHLDRSADSDEAWADLLGQPPLNSSATFYYRPTDVGVGFANGYALFTDVLKAGPVRFDLIRAHREWFRGCTILLFIVLLLLLWLALYSELLRDVGPAPAGAKKGWVLPEKKKHKPYSLARFQMAVWFFLVIVAFLYIWLVTGASDTITASTLALIGIGAGTALGAAVIDLGKTPPDSEQLKQLMAEKKTLESEIAALADQIKASAANQAPAALENAKSEKQARLNDVKSQIDSITGESNGFINDILTDGDNGISFHRFQMFVWTLVLAILFIYSVYSRLSMPEFSATLLGLMGISSGTYIGFKIPEKQS